MSGQNAHCREGECMHAVGWGRCNRNNSFCICQQTVYHLPRNVRRHFSTALQGSAKVLVRSRALWVAHGVGLSAVRWRMLCRMHPERRQRQRRATLRTYTRRSHRNTRSGETGAMLLRLQSHPSSTPLGLGVCPAPTCCRARLLCSPTGCAQHAQSCFCNLHACSQAAGTIGCPPWRHCSCQGS